jgi:hypothetical protein
MSRPRTCGKCVDDQREYLRLLILASRRPAGGRTVDLLDLLAAKEQAEECDHRPRGSQIRASTPGAAS